MGDLVRPIVVRRSNGDGKVSVSVVLSARGWSGHSVSVKGGTNLSTAAARELAAELVKLADESDAKVAKKKAADERRAKWKEREIAAGRMLVFR